MDRSGRQTPGMRRVRAAVALAVAAGLGALGGLIVSAATPPAYTATALSFRSGGATAALADHGGPGPMDVSAIGASLATAPTVLDPVIASLGLDDTARQLAARIDVESDAGTGTFRIAATDPSAVRAARIANAVQARFDTVASLRPITPAAVPLVPSAPQVAVDLAVGVLAGGLVWALVVVVRIARHRPALPRGKGLAAPSML